ncbi:MAG: polyketide cyclase [Rhizobiales bacterium]|nr:polyketide cyclase [Hyphomicrobiales bacterium]MBA70148.1 polyketide cyclase [Hyphomicrobiales bacterium]|tara:strand:- start:22 stop:375 length:354 start_codon:yes stop_codon:yes gene_type:complete
MTVSEDVSREIVCECELDAPPETVWRAVTIPEFLEEWMGIRPDENRDDDISCEIIDQSPGSQVRFAWHDGRTDVPYSVVTIDIEPALENRTRFRLSHSEGPRMRAANDNGPALRLAA